MSKRTIIMSAVVAAVPLLFISGYLAYAQISPVIRHNIFIGAMPVGGLTRKEALTRVAQGKAAVPPEAITAIVNNRPFVIGPESIELTANTKGAVEEAFAVGRSANVFKNIPNLLTLWWTTKPITPGNSFDEELLREQVSLIALQVDEPGKDIRLAFEGTAVEVLTDTHTGYILDQEEVVTEVKTMVARNAKQTKNIARRVIEPSVRLESAEEAKAQAERIIAKAITLTSDHRTVRVTPAEIRQWIQNKPEGPLLSLVFDEPAIHAYVTTLAHELNAEAQSPHISIVDGKVASFTVPKTGRALNQEKAANDILAELNLRRDTNDEATSETAIALEIETRKPEVTDSSATELGIVELIGSASTRFTGSPNNRISNIKNGVKFLSGILIAPGEEFSTLKALGTIDNTTGYLPELVIKENRTVPEFGGGLCQVSTTLFRSIMNTGLPITARRNHSYRVSYYEKDGDGNPIGPGLDATIYNPAPDFKFVNDTGAHILIDGHVEGDKITFNFYGTRDGRTSTIDGPYTLSSTAAGEPIYTETDTLPPGEQKQIERAHPGGTAIATYTIQYADGQEVVSEYKSVYRNWPAQFLVGAQPQTATSTPAIETPIPPTTSG